MKKLPIIFGVLVLVGQGCLSFISESNVSVNCAELTILEQRDACHLQEAIVEDDRTACPKIVDQSKQNKCYLELAVGANDITQCDSIQDAIDRENCIVAYSNTQLFGGINDCKQQEDVDGCLTHRAIVKQNPIVCAATSDYDACIGELIEDGNGRLPCLNVTGEDRFDCVVAVGLQLESDSVCSELESKSDQERCVEEINPAYKNAAAYFAGTMCIVSDPGFWEDFFEESDADQRANDDENYQSFLETYGYSDQQSAETDVQIYIDNETFRKAVTEITEHNCPSAIINLGMSYDELFDTIEF